MENKIDPHSIAVAVTTHYPKWYQGKLRTIKHTDKVRGDLALDFFQKATRGGYQVVVGDGKSSKTFRKKLTQIVGLTLIKRRSLNLSLAKKRVIKKAVKLPDVKAIVITEAEKLSLIDSLPQIVKPILEKKADIVIPKREAKLFKKLYPSYQYESEIEGNKLYNEILRTNDLLKEKEDFDIFFGPRAFLNTKKVVSLFTKKYRLRISKNAYLNSYFHYEDYSTTLSFPIVVALKKGLRIKSVEVPFSYPENQKENEERGAREVFEQKRRNQRISILVELLYFINYLNLT